MPVTIPITSITRGIDVRRGKTVFVIHNRMPPAFQVHLHAMCFTRKDFLEHGDVNHRSRQAAKRAAPRLQHPDKERRRSSSSNHPTSLSIPNPLCCAPGTEQLYPYNSYLHHKLIRLDCSILHSTNINAIINDCIISTIWIPSPPGTNTRP